MKYAKHQVSYRPAGPGTAELPCGEPIEVIEEATLAELATEFGEKRIVDNFLRQHTQDLANKHRVTFKNPVSKKALTTKLLAEMTVEQFEEARSAPGGLVAWLEAEAGKMLVANGAKAPAGEENAK